MSIIPAASLLAANTQKPTVAGKKSTATEKVPAKFIEPQPIARPPQQKVNSKRKQILKDVEEEKSPSPKRRCSTRLSTSRTTATAIMSPRIKLVHKATKKTESPEPPRITPRIKLVHKASKKTEATAAKQVNKKTAKGKNNRSSSASASSADDDDHISGQPITEIKAQKNMKKALADFLAKEAKKGEKYDLKSEYLFDLSMV